LLKSQKEPSTPQLPNSSPLLLQWEAHQSSLYHAQMHRLLMLLRPFRVRAKSSPQNPMRSLTTMLLAGPLLSTPSLLQAPF
jgi:hypothetical protein